MTHCITEMTAAEIKRLRLVIVEPDVFKAAREYKALKSRKLHPEGRFDNGGRFHLGSVCDYCKYIRTPSRAYPYSELQHGRSSFHVASQHGVEDFELEVKSYARLMEKYPPLSDSRDIAFSVISRAEANKALASLNKKKPKKLTPTKHGE